MILDQQIGIGEDGQPIAKPSNYRPSKAVKQMTQKVILEDFADADIIKNKSYAELNFMSVMDRQQMDQRRFNSFQEYQQADPTEDWKSNAVRPITRNRVISIAAHITGSIMYPNIFAQNTNDQEDKDAAVVMRDLMEWSNDQSEYEKTFVYSAIAALVNPAVIVHTEFAEVYRTVREKAENGSMTSKEVIDEVFSGFQDSIVPIDQIWIADFYIHDIQKQPYIIRRRLLTWEMAEAKYGNVPEFRKYVMPGVQQLFSVSTGFFYQQQDDNLKGRLVEEIIYWNRSKDLMLAYCNGVLCTPVDNPNPRQDKMYPFSKTGYELVDEGQFFWYKSLVNKLGPDEEVVQTLYRMVIDGTYLNLMPPVAVYGDEALESSVMYPGSVTTFSSPDAKMERLGVGNDMGGGLAMLQKVEQSMSESSLDPQQSGVADTKQQTAYEISKLEQNAKTMLGLFNKMIGFLVKDFGELRVSDILQYLTVGDVMQLESGPGSLKFRSFLIPDKNVGGKTKTRKIEFDMDMPDAPLSSKQHLNESFKLMDREGGYDSKTQIMRVNPKLFADTKFKLRITPDTVTPPSDNVTKALNLEAYDRAIANELTNKESVTRDLLLGSYPATKDDPDKYMMAAPAVPGDLASLIGQNGNQPGSQTGDMAQIQNQRRQEAQSQTRRAGV